VRWDSPIVLVVAGTLAIHTIFVVTLDIAMVTHPPVPPEAAPHLEFFEVKVEPPVPKPPPPPVQARAETPPEKDTTVRPRTRPTRAPAVRTATPPAPPETPSPSDVPSGGGPTIALPDIAPSATGVGVGIGKRTTGHIGRGGTGGGTGSGEGTGSGDAPPIPVSVATIKTRALPKGDYGYFDAGKDYPVEARRLGIEGPIRVRLIVDDRGKVKAAVLINHLGHGLDELALERARKIEFDPAKDTDDKPVSSVVVWTFNMTLPK
jgi:TonB family protein